MSIPPDNDRQVRVSSQAHEQLMRLAKQLHGSADVALRHLLGMSTIRVQVTDEQRERWREAARRTGVPVDEFIRLRIEACLQFGTDGAAVQRILNGVDALCRASGLVPRHVDPHNIPVNDEI